MELGTHVSLDIEEGGRMVVYTTGNCHEGTANVGMNAATSANEVAWPEIGDVNSGI